MKRLFLFISVLHLFVWSGVCAAQECDLDRRADRTYPSFMDEVAFVRDWNSREASLLSRLLSFGNPRVEYFILRASVSGHKLRHSSAIFGPGTDVEFRVLEVLVGEESVAQPGTSISFPDKELMEPCRRGLSALSDLAHGTEWVFPARAKLHGQHWQLLTFPHFLKVTAGVVRGALYNREGRFESSSIEEFRARVTRLNP